jgi:NADP-dependent 3-hydroxy acid dehydrogenase YdfG
MHHFAELAHFVAVVTGAGSGIGRAVTLALAASGATLFLVGRSPKKLEEVASCARARHAKVICCATDLTCDHAVRGLATRLTKEAGGVDVLVHSAGTIAMGPVESAPVDELDRQYRVNLRAPYLLTQALLPMVRARQGQIVFVNSTAGLAAQPNLSQYGATKFGLKAFADSLRAEINGEGSRVISVYAGRTATPMQAAVHTMEGKAYNPELLAQPEEIAGVIVAALTLPRTAEVTDVTVRPMRKPMPL